MSCQGIVVERKPQKSGADAHFGACRSGPCLEKSASAGYEGIEKLAARGSHCHAFKVFVFGVAGLEPATYDL
jgi:hypothetical protein